jgi:dihydroorotase
VQILIKRAKILDKSSSHHNKRLDIHIKNGVISQIGRNLSVNADTIIHSKNLHISPGWVDVGTQVGEPGFEHRETIETVANAAASGGYTAISCFPNTDPVLQSKSEINFINQQAKPLIIDIYPIGALSRNCKGEDLAEILDMRNSGSVGYSDGRYSIQQSGLLLRALQYVKTFRGIVLNKPYDQTIIVDGLMHESEMSTRLGVKGIPTIAETIMLERDLQLLAYTNSRYHAFAISSLESVKQIRDARKNGHDATASVPAINLLLNHHILNSFESKYKLLPPLRDSADIRGLIRGLKDGTIDLIVSNHEPLEDELKELEFEYAGFGSTGLQTAFAAAHTALSKKLPLVELIDIFSHKPRQLLHLPSVSVCEGEKANLTFFDPDIEWQFSDNKIRSKSKNDALLDFSFKGKVLGIANKNNLYLN